MFTGVECSQRFSLQFSDGRVHVYRDVLESASLTLTADNVTGSVVAGRKKILVLFNIALGAFYLQLYGVGNMVKDDSDSVRGNPLPP